MSKQNISIISDTRDGPLEKYYSTEYIKTMFSNYISKRNTITMTS